MTNSQEVKRLKETYIAGVKIRLTNMYGEPQMTESPEGTVDFVDDAGQIHVNWNNGSSLALIVGADSFEVIK